jgi:hypothetical protein
LKLIRATTPHEAELVTGDADFDEDIDQDDLLFWQQQFGTSPSGPLSAMAVPEPGTLALLLLAGLLALSLGLSRMYRDDLEQIESGMLLYDALYRWARDATDENHNWP